MPNQNECDHILGIAYDTVEVRMSDIVLPKVFNRHSICSKCGAKIDWDKIKEEVDGKQN